MPTYGKENFKESNVNYLNKDFIAIKNSLMSYAKSYFPNTYKDFNETSPGMMLLEMNAYVGDTLSFYIDQQYREMLLPLAEERRNIITMAKMFGYKVKPIVASFVNLTFTSEVNSHRSNNNASLVDYADAGVFDSGVEVPSSTSPDIIFTTLEPIDFTITGSGDTTLINSTDTDSGLADSYTLSRDVKAISATQKITTFKISAPEKFKKITISDTDVIDIVSCIDSNGNDWYEVDYLAQDKVPISTHWTEDDTRNGENQGAYFSPITGNIENTPIPYSLTYTTAKKRFTRETNLDNTTSLVFGNGILKAGIDGIDQGYIDMEQIGIVIPGQTNNLDSAIDPLLGNEHSTLGEAPNNTTLTITYRTGGGVKSNIPTGEITSLPSSTVSVGGNTSAELESVTNKVSARGGKDREDTLEIQEKTKAFFSTQNRCVTKEDYEARILNMSSKYGSIAKVYVTRNEEGDTGYGQSGFDLATSSLKYQIDQAVIKLGMVLVGFTVDPTTPAAQMAPIIAGVKTELEGLQEEQIPEITQTDFSTFELSAINIYILGYNDRKQLIGNPHTDDTGTNDNVSNMLSANIINYLDNFAILTDTFTINDGYIVNFGVFFDIIAEKYANKQEVKLKCIRKIQDYFKIEKMQFNQPIYKSNLEYELMGVEGVRSVGHVTLTQDYDYFYNDGSGDSLGGTYTYSADSTDPVTQIFTADLINGIFGYGFYYDFENALSNDGTVVLPPLTSTPTVFELKNPNTNIQGRVR